MERIRKWMIIMAIPPEGETEGFNEESQAENHNVPYDEYKPVYEDMTFYATWQELPDYEVVITPGEE